MSEAMYDLIWLIQNVLYIVLALCLIVLTIKKTIRGIKIRGYNHVK